MAQIRQRLYRWNSESIPQSKIGHNVAFPSAKLTVLLRIDGCRRLLQNLTFFRKVYLRSPGTVAGLSRYHALLHPIARRCGSGP
jgi:hypothetical protein